MLQTIHDKLKGIFAIVILVALGVVFVFWGVDVSVGSFTRARGIEVNGREIPVDEVRRSYQEELSRFEAAFGGAGVPEEMRVSMQQRALEQAVRTELIRQRTAELDFQTGNRQVLEAIRQIPAFQVEGQFSADAYHAALRSINLSPEQFEAEQREFVLATQLDRGISSSAFVLPGEFERQLAMRRETREVAWVIVPASQFTAAAEPDQAAIQAYYDAHQDDYRTEAWAAVDYILLDIDALAAGVAIDEQELREYYEANKQRYTRPGRRHARHILIETGSDPAAAEAEARAVYERARAGEDFAALAREVSDDTGSRESGGDLGFAERGDFDPAFADAVWEMKPGEVRSPVKSEFGWHVIRLEAIDPETTQAFDEVRAELEPELRRTQVEKQFGDAQEELDTLAFEATGDLASVAEKMNLPLRRIERYTRAGTPELSSAPQLTEAVFAPDVLAGRELRTVELAPGRVIALGVSGHEPVKTRPLAEVREQVVAAARLEAAQKQAAARAEAVAAELGQGADWKTATQAWQQTGAPQPRLVARDDREVPAEIRAAAFRSPVPQGKPQYGSATLAGGDAAIWSVTAVHRGSLAGLAPEEQKTEREQARERVAMSDASVYVAAMRANADVDVNPQLFE